MTVEVERCRGAGRSPTWSPTPGPTSGRARRRGWPGSPRRSTRSTAGPAASRSGSTWRRPRGRGPASATASSTSGAILERGRRAGAARRLRRHLPYFRGGLSLGDGRRVQWDDRRTGPGRRPGPGPGLAPQRQPSRAREPGRSPRGDRPRACWAWSRSGTSSTTRGSRDPDDPGDAQGDEAGEELDAINLRVLRRSGRSRPPPRPDPAAGASEDRRRRGPPCSTRSPTATRRSRPPPAPADCLRPEPLHQPRAELARRSTSACWRRPATRRIPLLERLRFLAISRLEPRRVLRGPRRRPPGPALRQPRAAGHSPPTAWGRWPSSTEISRRAHDFVARQYESGGREIRPAAGRARHPSSATPTS